jgi:hypothetical protein
MSEETKGEKTFRITKSWTCIETYEVEAKSLEEAIDLVQDDQAPGVVEDCWESEPEFQEEEP